MIRTYYRLTTDEVPFRAEELTVYGFWKLKRSVSRSTLLAGGWHWEESGLFVSHRVERILQALMWNLDNLEKG